MAGEWEMKAKALVVGDFWVGLLEPCALGGLVFAALELVVWLVVETCAGIFRLVLKG